MCESQRCANCGGQCNSSQVNVPLLHRLDEKIDRQTRLFKRMDYKIDEMQKLITELKEMHKAE